MQDCNKEFFSLILSVMRLEVKYEEALSDCNYLSFLLNKFGKEVKDKLSIRKYECANIKKQIDDLTQQITELQFDSQMQSYYDLYKERSELLKTFNLTETKMGYIQSTLIFDCVCDAEADEKIVRERNEFKAQNQLTTTRLTDIFSKMEAIYSG